MKSTRIDTPLGPMIAMADENALYLLEFVNKQNLQDEMDNFLGKKSSLVPGDNAILQSIKSELHDYFSGTLKNFKTPVQISGSTFQQNVWEALGKIPYGETRSYAALAAAVGNPKAVRAVGGANGANRLAIIIPCHRVVANDGSLGGYSAGTTIKQWLLEHENVMSGKNGHWM